MVFTPGMERTLSVRVESTGADEFVGSLDDAIETLGGFKAAVGLAGGALAALSAGALAKATASAAEFEQAMVEVQKVTDETTAAALSADIRELASTIPIAQSELAAITADAARFGIRGTENINRFTETVARMATATDLSTQEAGEAFARLATLTRTPVSELENLGSAINTLSNNFATSSQEIVDSMLRSSGSLAQLGLQQTEMVALSAALNEVSESSERAGTRLRRLGQELLEPAKQEALGQALGMTTSEFRAMAQESPVQLIRLLAETMNEGGTAAEALRTELSTTSRTAVTGLAQNLDGLDDALGQSTRSFDEATSLQEEFEAATDTTAARARVLKNRLGNLAITTGEGLLPVVNDLIGGASMAVGGFNDFNRALDGLPAQITAVAGAATGLAVLLSSFGIAAGGPVALAVAGIGALGIAWSQNAGEIQDVTAETAAGVAGSFARIGAALGLVEGNIDEQKDSWDALVDFWDTRLAQGLDIIGTGFVTLADIISTSATIGIQAWSGFGEVMRKLIAGDFKGAKEAFEENASDIENSMSDFRQRLRDEAVGLSERTERRRRGLPGFVPTEHADTEETAAEQGKSDAEAYMEAYRDAIEKEASSDAAALTGADGATTGTTSGTTLSAEDRAALVRQVGEQAVRARRRDDATEIPGRTAAMAADLARGGPAPREVIEMHNRVTVDATVEANSREGGEAAAAGLEDELRSANIVDTGTVTAR